jgi:hypothetical protein
MSASPAIALRRAALARLAADARLTTLLGAAKIFDEAPRANGAPYALFAEWQMRDWSTGDGRGAEHFFVVAVISTERGTREAIKISQRVVELLDEAALTLEDHALIDLRFQTMETRREQNGRFARANLRFRATTEAL